MTSRRRKLIRRRRRRILLAMAAVLLAVFSAREPHTADWSPAELPVQSGSNWTEFNHVVAFADAGSGLSEAIRARLETFVKRLAQGGGVQVSLAARTDTTDPNLAGERVAAVTAYLRELGISPAPGATDAPNHARAGSVTVTVGRYMYTPPDCPGQRDGFGPDGFNEAPNDFYCTVKPDPAPMAADPDTILYGLPARPGDDNPRATGTRILRGNVGDPPLRLGQKLTSLRRPSSAETGLRSTQ